MITNKVQYNLTMAQAAEFEKALRILEADGESDPSIHPLLRAAEHAALQSQLESLKAEIAEYESLRSGKRRRFTAESLGDLPRLLIQARIARGLTQKQVAERLGLKEQQIQRYEATEYRSASFKRINEVVQALDVQVREEIALK